MKSAIPIFPDKQNRLGCLFGQDYSSDFRYKLPVDQ